MLHGLKVHPAQDQPQGSKQPAHKLCGTPRKLSTSGSNSTRHALLARVLPALCVLQSSRTLRTAPRAHAACRHLSQLPFAEAAFLQPFTG